MSIAEVSTKKKLSGIILAFIWVSLAVYLYVKADIHPPKIQDDLPVVIMSKEGGL